MAVQPWDAETELLFRRCHLFAGLSETHLIVIRERARLLRLREAEALFHYGQPAKRFFLLKSGRVKLFRVSREGVEKVIEIVQPNNSFAEAVMFMEAKNYPVNAEALCASEILSFDSQALLEILRNSAKACFNVMGSLSMRLHSLVEEIEKLTLQNATYRLVAFLLKHVPEHQHGASEIELPVPKRVIASRLSIQPETLSRLLQRLSKDNWITVSEQNIRIHNVDRLREFIEADDS